MEDFTLFDAGVAGILVISAILAYSRGFVREALSIAGWIAAGIAAFYFAPQVEPMIREIPILGDFLGDNCELWILAAFAIVFAVALVVIALFTPLVSGAVQNSAIGSLDSGLGFLFGVARGALLIVVTLVVYDFFIAGGEGFPIVEGSKTKMVFAEQEETLKSYIPTDIPAWLIEPYEELTSSCTGQELTEEAAPVEG